MADLAGIVYKVNSFEETISGLSDAQLKEKTDYFRQHISDKARECASQIEQLEAELFEVAIPEEKDRIKEKIKSTRNKIFEDILAESFAVVREASKRAIGLRHFDVQIAGGVILHEGKISEMSTGEGKTLVATLAAYLNALLGKGVHIVTVNDYLARRDREWMGPVFEFLGLTVGVIQHEMDDQERQAAYNCDITYGTNNEFGFDYLRDNMKYNLEDLVQRGFYFAIVDEVDSILIDEARTPLIISGPAEEATDKYYTARHIADSLKGRRVLEKDEINAKHKGIDLTKGYEYLADEKARTISLTEDGESRAAKLWGVESLHNIDTMEFRHHTIQALRAKEFFQRDVDYVVKDGEVIIVDEFTGRMMPGRRWSDGLHQAVEAKEGIKIERENQTLATVTFQNYFRMYEKLSGMTGTASTEANEFKDIYRLDVVNVPTNRPLIRHNYPDCIYRTEKEKFKAVVDEICELHEKGRPVLVGTVSIDKSEKLSEMLKMRGIEHEVLNAKHHEREAQIVAQAGHYKAVTIATNMAGRGTDILLGGNPDFLAKSFIQHKLDQEAPDYNDQVKKALQDFKQSCLKEHEQVVALDGLHVLATERHEARRIDNQLRGRCARQGDPGSSRFYISLEDNLMRLFGSDKISGMMAALGLEEGQVIEHPWVTRSIEVAQKRVEQHNFEIRKQLLDYDNVMNKQREVIYAQRRDVLEGLSLKDSILDVAGKIIEEKVNAYVASENDPEARDFQVVFDEMRLKLGIEIEKKDFEKSAKDAAVYLLEKAQEYYNNKEQAIGEKMLRHLERMVFLQIIDTKWKEHLYAMDSLREGIGLRAYGQRDPLIEYKREAFEMFAEMIATIEEEAAEIIFKLQPQSQQEKFKQVFSARSQRMLHPDAEGFPEQGQAPGDTGSNINAPVAQQQATSEKVGRNQPCPCGSGKKYKKCCGK
ncbi:MAG: preprotein translocase subunit SecA [Candidatus Omnitrophica bacterium]|nr:preprotein translocase subunit SecA [Candidatus Omnitrophota bacterium]